ncbi:hypothetical protein QJS66_17735 [Kocuria rhizophila]|nr:hypothetical protein QJS66_17735 [Kocuria rhizophila]
MGTTRATPRRRLRSRASRVRVGMDMGWCRRGCSPAPVGAFVPRGAAKRMR